MMMIFNAIVFFSIYWLLGLTFTACFKRVVKVWLQNKQLIERSNIRYLSLYCDCYANDICNVMIWPVILFYFLGFYFGERVFKRNYKHISSPELLSYIKPINPITMKRN